MFASSLLSQKAKMFAASHQAVATVLVIFVLFY